MGTRFVPGPHGEWRAQTSLRGTAILGHPLLNRGSAFTQELRRQLHLEGRLPSVVSSLEQQAQRAWSHVEQKTDPLEKYIGLTSLMRRNEVLFYRLLVDHLEALMPIVYTPTVGDATQAYSRIFRHPKGLWITPAHRGRVEDIIRDSNHGDIRLIVITDNERILGLGDLGAGGMGIPVGKLALYTACAGIHPSQTLPISLDVGTDNSSLLEDELYIGWREPRLRGQAYRSLVDEVVHAVKACFPHALLQWEDFKKQNAIELLDTYRETLPSFNDDIEGTAAVALAGVLAASRLQGRTIDKQRFLIAGAGAAGLGIARLLRTALAKTGMSEEEQLKKIAVTDSRGLVIIGQSGRDTYKDEIAWPEDLAKAHMLPPNGQASLKTVVEAIQPTVLIGTTGLANSFDEQTVRAMAAHTETPIIFPFSNPTANAEAHPQDLLDWTSGTALIATGSPFGIAEHNGVKTRVGQGNNVYVYPGIGLGCLIAEATRVLPSMFEVAAETLAAEVTEEDLAERALFPRVGRLREVSAKIAYAVALEARNQGVGRDLPNGTYQQLVQESMWDPKYPELELQHEA